MTAPVAPGATNFSRRLLAVVGIGLLVFVAWQLIDLLVLTFAAIVLAVALHALARSMHRRLRIPQAWAVMPALLLIAAVLAILAWFVGDALVSQLASLRTKLPDAANAVQAWLRGHSLGQSLLNLLQEARQSDVPWGSVLNTAGVTVVALGNVALILILAIYLAAAPDTYRRGALRLLPVVYRDRVDAALSASASALRKWLLGQAISMLFIGSTTTIGLTLLGIPLAFAVGLVSGALAFIPFFGAIIGGMLAVLVAFIEGPQAALYVAILALAIQQIEGNVLMPLVQRWAVALPPVLGILASVVFGVLFGVVGVLFATPLMVVVMTLVQRLYVEDFLEQSNKSQSPSRNR
ncbi:MAG TPA: AI-2E family transporter [Burkholderiaceae bacterium]|nr:AI-2E family transporter [Burkholderiaceae bacterium]